GRDHPRPVIPTTEIQRPCYKQEQPRTGYIIPTLLLLPYSTGMHRRKPFDDYDPDRFISGVYNYCDRWCERCRFNTRCLVYHEEQQRTAEHLLNDEDPNDMEVVMADVSDSFRQTIEMLQEMAEEMGVDLDSMDSEDEVDALFEEDEEGFAES